jgi:uncharacterized damage-inducible protein DinB
LKSVHGTLNHLLATDRIWMQRFTGEGDAPIGLVGQTPEFDLLIFQRLSAKPAA